MTYFWRTVFQKKMQKEKKEKERHTQHTRTRTTQHTRKDARTFFCRRRTTARAFLDEVGTCCPEPFEKRIYILIDAKIISSKQ